MSIFSNAVDTLFEELKRPFYSEREAQFEKFKNSSQMTKEFDLETQHISFNPFGSYVHNQMGDASSNVAKYDDMVRKWRDVAQLPEVDGALNEITGEAIVFDEIDQPIALNLDDIELSEPIKDKIRDSFEHILFMLDFNEKGEELFRQWYVDGTLNVEVVYNNRKPKDGILKLVLLPPFNIYKFKGEESAKVKWYINTKPTYNMLRDLEDSEKSFYDEQITQITSGQTTPDKKMWVSALQKAVKAVNQLYLLEDSLVIYRLTRSPEKRVFYIDTGNLPKAKAEEYVKNLIMKYRQKKVYDTEKGTVENKNKAVSILEDFWFPVNAAGKGTKVETLAGLQPSFTGFDDVNYFIDKVYKALNIPANRRLNKENRMTIGSGIDIEKDEMNFFKFIQRLRRRFNNLFVDLLKKDLLAKQVMTLEDWKKIQEKIKFKYADSNEISTIKKMQIWQIKIDTAGAALPLVDVQVVDNVWIQKEILRLTDEEIQEMAARIAAKGGAAGALGDMGGEGGGGGGGDMAGGGTPEGYEEVGGEAPPEAAPEGSEGTPAPAAEGAPPAAGGGGRFKQKQKESGLSQNILNNLMEGDIITNGTRKLKYVKGRFQEVK
jgi:hypothetical protein